ncbi:MAG: CDP-diacylglycerol--glycerol-3-phosphate 3-phosphatidyltransferase [Candidatus Binatia bacterium]
MLNLPNFLTLIRIAAIPLFLVLLYSGFYTSALLVFIIGAITDALDGPVARLTNQSTPLGAYLDPIADKLLIMSSVIVLGIIGAVPAWLTILIVSRDLIIMLGYGAIYYLAQEWMEARPSRMGKLNTLFQLCTITAVLVFLHDSHIVAQQLLYYLFLLTAVTTVVSGFQYVYRGLIWLQNRASSLPRIS